MEIRVEELSVDEVYILLVRCEIGSHIADQFRERAVDGNTLARLTKLPISLLPTPDLQLKFNNFYEALTGHRLEHPHTNVFEPNHDTGNGSNSVSGDGDDDEDDTASSNGQQQQQANTQSTVHYPSQPQVATQAPAVNNQATVFHQISYPAPLPVFTSITEAGLNNPDQCLDTIYMMNRELVDFYIVNNYQLSTGNDYRNVCQTVLDRYRALNYAVTNSINNGRRGRTLSAVPYLTKKLRTRRQYVLERARSQELQRLVSDPQFLQHNAQFRHLVTSPPSARYVATVPQSASSVVVQAGHTTTQTEMEVAAALLQQLQQFADANNNYTVMRNTNTEPMARTVEVPEQHEDGEVHEIKQELDQHIEEPESIEHDGDEKEDVKCKALVWAAVNSSTEQDIPVEVGEQAQSALAVVSVIENNVVVEQQEPVVATSHEQQQLLEPVESVEPIGFNETEVVLEQGHVVQLESNQQQQFIGHDEIEKSLDELLRDFPELSETQEDGKCGGGSEVCDEVDGVVTDTVAVEDRFEDGFEEEYNENDDDEETSDLPDYIENDQISVLKFQLSCSQQQQLECEPESCQPLKHKHEDEDDEDESSPKKQCRTIEAVPDTVQFEDEPELDDLKRKHDDTDTDEDDDGESPFKMLKSQDEVSQFEDAVDEEPLIAECKTEHDADEDEQQVQEDGDDYRHVVFATLDLMSSLAKYHKNEFSISRVNSTLNDLIQNVEDRVTQELLTDDDDADLIQQPRLF